MIKHALWEGLSSGVGAQISGESERLVDGQESLDDEHGRSGNLRFLEDVTTTTIKHSVDTSDGDFRALDLAQVDGLHEARSGCEIRSVQDATSCWNDLTASTMDSISVQCHVVDVEADS